MTSWPKQCVLGALVALSLVGAPQAHAHGDLHAQITALTKQIEREPHNAELFHKRGELERAHGDYAAALRDYAWATRFDPGLDVVHLSRGRSLLESGDAQGAVEALSAFLNRQPTHAGGLLLRARARARLGLHAAAERDFAAVLQITDDPTPDLFLERAANLAVSGQREAAVAALDSGIARIGDVVTLTQAAVDLEVALRRYDAALTRLDRMLSSSPRKERLLAGKADVLDAAGRAIESRAVREEALRLIASLPEMKRTLEATRSLESGLRSALAKGP